MSMIENIQAKKAIEAVEKKYDVVVTDIASYKKGFLLRAYHRDDKNHEDFNPLYLVEDGNVGRCSVAFDIPGILDSVNKFRKV